MVSVSVIKLYKCNYMKIRIVVCVICILGLMTGLYAQQVKLTNNLNETRISLNGLWNFKADYYNKGEDQGWQNPNFNDLGWDKMDVPGNWDIHNEYAEFMGKGWYRTRFDTPSETKGKVVCLNFEAIGIDYKVWLNGEQIANVVGGYFPNCINVTTKLNPSNQNSLVVCADNSFHSGAYWSWGGIRRPVTLIVNEPLYIVSAKITAIPDLQKGTAKVDVNTLLFNNDNLKGDVNLSYELSFDGKMIKKELKKEKLFGNKKESLVFEFTLNKKDVKLWHFDFPNLYSIKIALNKDGLPIHEICEHFGIRKVEIVDGKFMLNGETVRLVGLNWVADDRLTGNTLPFELYKRDIDNMKSLGCNLTRLSHLPLPKDVSDYLDEKGILVIAEIPVWGTTKLAEPENSVPKEWMKQLVNDNFNHPCIIAWCVGNEITNNSLNPKVMEYGEKMIKYVKDSLDHSRLVVLVSNTANYQKEDASQFGDFVAYNVYNSWGDNINHVHEHQPNKMLFISEYGSSLVGENINNKEINIHRILDEVRGRKYLFGASIWTYNDYRSFYRSSDPTWDTKVSQNRDWGVVDAYGNKKRAYEQIRKEYAPLKSLVAKESKNDIDITLQPRCKLDLPAFIMRGYKLVREDMDQEFRVILKTEIELPVIHPGDIAFKKSFVFGNEGNKTSASKISLLNPTNYELMDTVIYNTSPLKPSIKNIFNDGIKIRVVFDHVAGASEYKVLFGESKLDKESETTIDTYLEIETPTDWNSFGKTYQVQLVALNGFGESKSDIQKVTFMGIGKLAPVIKAVRAYHNGISIGYSSNIEEYLYKVQYSTSPDFSFDVHEFQTNTKGACYIPDLTGGNTYYIRMSVVAQYNIQSPWGETWSLKL